PIAKQDGFLTALRPATRIGLYAPERTFVPSAGAPAHRRRLERDEREEARAAQLTPPAPGLHRQPVEPLQPRPADEARRPAHPPGHVVEHAADPERHADVERGQVARHPA